MIEAEAEVPKAMASALREGKLGVLDYYQMQNTIADTPCVSPSLLWAQAHRDLQRNKGNQAAFAKGGTVPWMRYWDFSY